MGYISTLISKANDPSAAWRASVAGILLMSAFAASPRCLAQAAKSTSSSESQFTIHPDQPQQVVWGMGFEIQSDSIASGNRGLPPALTSVPHDLVPSERDRLADQMLKGFRYCRLAGGLYWRGLDAEQKHLQPRWPEQLTELKTLLDRAGVESLSFEYWSPAPFWKANGSYTPVNHEMSKNILRCFGPGFATDAIYHGDVERFLADFAHAVCDDIKTLQAAGLKVGFFGLQNEPFANTPYSSCPYSIKGYGQTFRAVASAIREADPTIKIIADTGPTQPNFIAPVLKDPSAASLVDLLCIHDVGCDSSAVMTDVRRTRKMVSQPLPIYQNEYEYLSGRATPARCVNTVQHIMNWYQLAASPTWYWIHCLKPISNSEASGYALGFWRPIDPAPVNPDAVAAADGPRNTGKARVRELPNMLIGLDCVSIERGGGGQPAPSFTFTIDRPADIYLAVHRRGTPTLPATWEKTAMTDTWDDDQEDSIYRRRFDAGVVEIPGHDGHLDNNWYGAPNLAIIKPIDNTPVHVSQLPADLGGAVGVIAANHDATADLEPGHFTWNNFNWFSVVGFLKYMPWDSTVVKLDEANFHDDRRILAFKRPDGKLVLVVSNRTGKPFTFDIDTGSPASSRFSGFRYTPEDAGPDFMGQPVGGSDGARLKITVPDLSWEFWVQQS